MEQGGISIMSPPGVVEGSVGKSKSIGITLRSNGSMRTAKEKLKTPWLKKLMKVDTTLWDTFLAALGEVIGTGILLFLGCMGCVGTMGIEPTPIQIALTFGLAIMAAIQCVGHISGAHLNPAVTAAAVILGNISIPIAGVYMVAQCLGGLIGYGLLKMITPYELLRASNLTESASFCTNDVYGKLSPGAGVAAELLATAILVFFAAATWDPRNARTIDSLSLRFGLCVTVLCFAFVPYTGCSMNPARTFAPALWNGYWSNHWVYWIGPFLGAIISASIYRCVFLPKTNREDSKQDANTLNGIET
ncbi:PREDICTED: aquaporin AQPAe.a-like [Dinoponera quadriceps]|uniref:Aquaporin AQPAe.a-like n=1 Tax=Dinoponera quadriceps TaxID=609295 RepID=A0A6P3X8U9_DINQU|nr:PREDICTED: aquaporin AQPAe.a-like [Dinoponera quadriceps]XP_014474305.1 PREDICTED: aquaporin AQPAe.a-like [Dinoponera quadriceps]XP_014474307.1 PREDICTED: aquaporin AQPAe.a-like [Dinoponera quadriceps]